ncbi:hypothetical protein DQ237_10365 [Blastococcus sp. TF02-8]|uniref:polysaccharide biosynthesis tyrosine autokinase n=1 Tax=Blastococcus sp. TF02-8 TaxID=2250574 RepID=UPI000DEAD5E3|nr:polysaccharide biosynthesis tyrosine autokinase [Blastococcus sp. TF02-8]RBY96255.1 hypothetical protein DQ237_10365 [Blastococcus sp. TF02-8]
MDLQHFVRIVRRRWRLLALVVLASTLGAAAAAAVQRPAYETTSVLVATTGAISDGAVPTQAAAQRALDLSRFAVTRPVVIEAVAEAARASGLPERTPDGISAEADGVSPFLTLTVTDRDPQWAQAVANAYLAALPDALDDIDPGVAASAEQLTSLTPAALPTTPSNPDWSLYLSMGLLLGLALGTGLVIFREAVQKDSHDPDDMARVLNLPMLGIIPLAEPKETLPLRASPTSPRAEAYRAVQASLSFLREDGPPRSLVVTSASSGEGVSTVVANVGLSLSGSGRRVILVDANLRRPSLHELFGLTLGPGLADALTERSTLAEALQTIEGTTLRVLSAGTSSDSHVEMLTSARMPELLRDLQKECDVLLLDTPPLLPVADALFLAVHAAGVLLVARVGTATGDRLRRTLDAMRTVNAPMVGFVVNGGEDDPERMGPRRLPRRHRERTTPPDDTNAAMGETPDAESTSRTD